MSPPPDCDLFFEDFFFSPDRFGFSFFPDLFFFPDLSLSVGFSFFPDLSLSVGFSSISLLSPDNAVVKSTPLKASSTTVFILSISSIAVFISSISLTTSADSVASELIIDFWP